MESNAPVCPGLLFMLSSPVTREEGFRLLMKRHGQAVYWHIRRIVVGREDAEDVLAGYLHQGALVPALLPGR